MPRRKDLSYNELNLAIAELMARKDAHREKMARIITDELDDEAACKMGDLSDAELRRLAKLIAGDIGSYVERVVAARRLKAAPKAKTDVPVAVTEAAVQPAAAAPVQTPLAPEATPDKPLIHGEVREHGDGVFGIWDKDSDEWYAQRVGAGMDFEIRANFLRQWFRTRSEVCTEGEREGKIIFPITANGGKRVEVDCSPGLLVRSIVPGHSLPHEGN